MTDGPLANITIRAVTGGTAGVIVVTVASVTNVTTRECEECDTSCIWNQSLLRHVNNNHREPGR